MRFPEPNSDNGTLYVVATPIGNLEDITHRAVRILGEVDVIACEDTRRTATLCNHYGIKTPRVSYHDHNKNRRGPELIERLENGENIALVSDAGTPSIADPGYVLVTLARESQCPVVPIPGPNAIITALSAAGAPTDRFEFLGFLPKKSGRRGKAFEEIISGEHVVAVYESPHRLIRSLEELGAIAPDCCVYVGRELTKAFEEFLSGRPLEVVEAIGNRTVKGELVVLIDPRGIGLLKPGR